ncbi:MAG: GYD domain-containing protein [Dehalococcoidia bacterium]|jgi:uncharacterized protein with GYD domain|nr:GYD domain-containing protein [Dehalococcoidia bacterium]
MARYMIQASYSSEGIAVLVKDPQDRSAAVRRMIERMGGKLETFDYCFGDYDVVAILELPDNVTMMSTSMAIASSGALKNFKTTVLLPMDQALEAMRKASSVGYQPPGH